MKSLVSLVPFVLHAAALAVGWTLCDLGLWFLAPVGYPLSLVLAAGLTSCLVRRHVREGRFDRDPNTPLYRGRMIYGAAWTSLYYCKPVLHAITTCPLLKKLTYRLFGYRGSMDFTIYPDAWVRDLRLLDFGPGTYVANRATLGTNVVRTDGRIQVAGIRTGRNVLIGHLAMVGGGTVLGDATEVGVATKVGFKVKTGERVNLGPSTVVDSGSRLHDDVVVGASVHIGKRCVIHRGVSVPAGAVIPDRTVLRTDADVARVLEEAPALRMVG